jgi:LmbE family N-acetylglucosaminyl deacetylase
MKMNFINLDGIERVLIFGAHPDDEIIGPGGSAHRFSSQCKEVYVATFTCGGTAANSPEEMQRMIEKRKTEMQETDKVLGITKREVLGIASQQVYGAVYGDNKLHHELIRLIRQYRPHILFTHSSDNHRDHNGIAAITRESAFQASESILGNLGEPWLIPVLLYYSVEQELPTSNVIIEIGKTDLDAKLAAMATQISQTRGDYLRHFQEMMAGRAQLWGAKLFGAGKYAEPFYLEQSRPLLVTK